MTKKIFDIVILTDNRYIEPDIKNWYINQVLLEDKILQEKLESIGMKVCRKDWADHDFDWNSTKYAIFRTTWDYFDRFDEFFLWINQTKDKTNFINSTDIIYWNIDKYYLRDLSEKGINITSSLFIEKNKKINLKQLFEKTKWIEAVIKPTISGAARHTYRINTKNYNKYEDLFRNLIKNECMIFQEFMHNVTLKGEISLIMIAGKYTHAVRKIAKKGDFRVQDDHGGKVIPYEANSLEIEFAKQCIVKCPFSPIYARVDIIYDNKNKPALVELELIEPELWFRNNTESALLLAKEIARITSSK